MNREVLHAVESSIKESNIVIGKFAISTYVKIFEKYLEGYTGKDCLGNQYVLCSNDEIMKDLEIARSTVRKNKFSLKKAGLLHYELEKFPKYTNRFYLERTFFECVNKYYKQALKINKKGD